MNVPRLLAVALLVAGCSDAVSPHQHGLHRPSFAATAGAGITLDQANGAFESDPWGANGTHIGKGFNPRNPHVGDAIVATFFWHGSTNTIVEVTDHLSDAAQTPVGNTYTLVEYVTADGLSMATYVATNVQGFSDADTNSGKILAVHAIFSARVTGGVKISAWSGVNTVTAQALAAHRSAAGAGAGITPGGPGSIPLDAGSLAYAVTMSNGHAGFDRPSGFTQIGTGGDTSIIEDGEYAVPGDGAPVDPRWAWYFSEGSQSTWLATALALNPAAEHLVFTTQPTTTMPLMTVRPPVQVTVVDGAGNTLTSFTGSVTIAIGRNGGMLIPGTLSGTKTVAAVNGVATFSDLSIDQPGSGYTLTVVGPGVAGAESAPFAIGGL
jgi:hypothetical protein